MTKTMTDTMTDSVIDRQERRLARLRDELRDEGVDFPYDGDLGRQVLVEIDYARTPRVHEQQAPAYGCLLLSERDTPSLTEVRRSFEIPIGDLPLPLARRFADGRTTFVRFVGARHDAVVCFANSVEEEPALLDLAHNGAAFVVQRRHSGTVKALFPDCVAVWDGLGWLHNPRADAVVPRLRDVAEPADQAVLDGLLELSLHWLSPARVGATLVWSRSTPTNELSRLDRSRRYFGPKLSVTRREHLPALFSALVQTDGATLVEPDGHCTSYRVTLHASPEAVEALTARGGTRHDSARRYTYDHPDALAVVVSADGPVTIYVAGERRTLSGGTRVT